jgi:hypothetical protein
MYKLLRKGRMRIKSEVYYFLTQTFFLGGTSPQRTCSMGRGRSKCPSYHPPTPYTLSPLLKGGEGRGEGGSYTRMPCPFGALLVTLYHFKSKAFLMGGRGGHDRLRGERQLHITLPSYIQKPFARKVLQALFVGAVCRHAYSDLRRPLLA